MTALVSNSDNSLHIPAQLKPRKIVGICGLKFHGKDTAAQVLIDDFGFKRVSFADGLKEVVARALRIDVAILHDPARKEEVHTPSGKTYRQWLQIAGTEWFRTMWEDVWINYWKQEIYDNDLDKVVVTDMRFPNELAAVMKISMETALTVRIFNPRVPVSGDMHESEKHALTLPVGYVLNNESTIEALRHDMAHLYEMKYTRRMF